MSQLFTRSVIKGQAVTLGLFLTNAGAGVDPVLAAGDVKISKNGAALVNVTALPTKVAGAAAGAWLLTLAAGDVDTAGPLLVQIVKAGVDTLVAFVDISVGARELLDAIVEGANQYDGAGEVGAEDMTVAQSLREILAYVGGNATGLDGQTVVLKSRGGARNRIVATMVNGNRAVTSRSKT